MKCEFCGEEHDGNFGAGRFCSQSCASKFSTKNYKKETKILKCEICGKEQIVGKRAPKIRCSICKEKLKSRKTICVVCNKPFNSKYGLKKTCSEICYKKLLSENAKKCSFGGYVEGTERSKGGYRTDSFGKQVWLQSSYEFLCADILDELKIKWLRPNALFYKFSDKKCRYFPDFYLPEKDLYLDPKNDFLAKKDKLKISLVQEQNKVKVLILTKNKLNKEFWAT